MKSLLNEESLSMNKIDRVLNILQDRDTCKLDMSRGIGKVDIQPVIIRKQKSNKISTGPSNQSLISFTDKNIFQKRNSSYDKNKKNKMM